MKLNLDLLSFVHPHNVNFSYNIIKRSLYILLVNCYKFPFFFALAPVYFLQK